MPSRSLVFFGIVFGIVFGLGGVAFGLVGALVGALVGVLVGALVGTLVGGLHVGLAIGLVIGPAFGLHSMFTSKHLMLGERVVYPLHEEMRHFVKNGLFMGLGFWLGSGLIIGLIIGLIFRLVFGPAGGLGSGLAFGLGGGLAFGLILGLDVPMRYYILRFWLWCARTFPWRVKSFSEDATARFLLRRVGDGNSFAHRLLLDYFADLNVDTLSAPADVPPTS